MGENGAWVYTGTAQIFWVPPIISGTDKTTNFKFGRYIHRVHPNKSPLKFWEKMEHGRIQDSPNFWSSPLQISGKVAGCVVRTLETFQGTHILGASRGLLCDSSAVLSSIFTRFRDIAAFVLQYATFSYPTSSLPHISPCSPGTRWMAFGLRRANLLG